MSIESLVEVRGLTKKYAMTKHFGVVAVLTDDISGMTYVARWIKTGFLEEVPEGLSWDEITKLAKNYERERQGLTKQDWHEIWEQFDESSWEIDEEFQKEMVAKHGEAHYYIEPEEDWKRQKVLIEKLVEAKMKEKNNAI